MSLAPILFQSAESYILPLTKGSVTRLHGLDTAILGLSPYILQLCCWRTYQVHSYCTMLVHRCQPFFLKIFFAGYIMIRARVLVLVLVVIRELVVLVLVIGGAGDRWCW